MTRFPTPRQILKPLSALSLAICLSLPAGAEIARPAGQRETLHLMYEATARLAPDLAVTMNEADLSLAITLPDGGSLALYPDNLDLALRGEENAGARQEIFDKHMASVLGSIRATMDGSLNAEIDPSAILPVIRAPEAMAQSDPGQLPQQPFPGGLVQYWVVDDTGTTASLNAEDMTTLGMEADAVADLAISNLEERLDKVTFSKDGIYNLAWLDGYYESSLMLLPAFWQDQAKGHDSLIAAIPTRETMVWITDASAAEIGEMREVVFGIFQSEPYSISSDLFRWTGEGWEVVPR